jgi:hypothetical protein
MNSNCKHRTDVLQVASLRKSCQTTKLKHKENYIFQSRKKRNLACWRQFADVWKNAVQLTHDRRGCGHRSRIFFEEFVVMFLIPAIGIVGGHLTPCRIRSGGQVMKTTNQQLGSFAFSLVPTGSVGHHACIRRDCDLSRYHAAVDTRQYSVRRMWRTMFKV